MTFWEDNFMQKLTLAILISLIVCFVSGVAASAREVDSVTDKLIRIHIIANSDSEEDQSLKLKVRDSVLEVASGLISECTSKEEAMTVIRDNIVVISSAASETVEQSGCEYAVNCSLSEEEFDERVYDDFTLPAGDYDALCVRIGDAEGKNWWCVCYPSLCFGSAVSIDDCEVFTEGELTIVKEPEKVRYKLWCYEIARKILKLFD